MRLKEPKLRYIVHTVHGFWKDWCWSWNSNTAVTWCKELTHLKRPWCWERLNVGGEGDDRGWDGWMASPIQWTWVWVNSVSWWWTGRLGVLQSMGSKRVGHDWVTELNWTERKLHWVLRPASNFPLITDAVGDTLYSIPLWQLFRHYHLFGRIPWKG